MLSYSALKLKEKPNRICTMLNAHSSIISDRKKQTSQLPSDRKEKLCCIHMIVKMRSSIINKDKSPKIKNKEHKLSIYTDCSKHKPKQSVAE